MSTDMFDLQDFGLLHQSADGATNIVYGTTYYYPGLYPHSIGDFPLPQYDNIQYYHGSKLTPYISRRVKTTYMPIITYLPTDMYLTVMSLVKFGSANMTESSGVYTVTPDDTETQRYAMRYQMKNSALSGIYKDIIDNVTLSHSLTIDLSKPNEQLVAINTSQALSMQDSFSTRQAPRFHSGGDSPYVKDSNTVFNVVTLDDTIELIDTAFEFTLQIDNYNRVERYDNEPSPQRHLLGNKLFSGGFAVENNIEVISLVSELFQERGYDSLPSIVFKIYNGTGKYTQFTIGNVRFSKPKLKHAIFRDNDVPKFDVLFTADNLTLEFKDGLTTTEYGM